MLDSNVSTYIDKDGNVQEVGSGGLSFPISYTGTATDAKIDLITDYEGNREKYTTITPSSVVVGNGMSSSKLEISSSDNSESTYIRFSPNGGSSVELYADSGDGDGAVLTIEGKPILASSNVDPEYANTSEIVDGAITLTSTSTLNDLVSQILANKTKVSTISADDANIKRLLGTMPYTVAPSGSGYNKIEFKVISLSTTTPGSSTGEGVIQVVLNAAGYNSSPIPHTGYIVHYPNFSDWAWRGWNTEAYPINSIYLSTSSTSPSSLFGGTWEQIKDVFLLAAGDTYTAGSTGGEATHTLTVAEMPAHSHTLSVNDDNNPDLKITYYASWASGSLTGTPLAATSLGNGAFYIYANTVGGSAAHNNMPPYLTVYMWKRIA